MIRRLTQADIDHSLRSQVRGLYTPLDMQPISWPSNSWLIATVLACALIACTAPEPSEVPTTSDVQISADVVAAPEQPELIFINLLPWGEIDFSRGDFQSIDACTELVRSMPNYSGYTTPERCESITDPVYCSVWQDGDDPQERIGCFKGIGGCEVELRRHDLLAESGNRTIITRCEPSTLVDAWAHAQTETAIVTSTPSP